MKKKVLCLFLGLIIIFSAPLNLGEAAKKEPAEALEYDNIKILKDVGIEKFEDTIFLPLRKVGEALGFKVEWNKELRQAQVSKSAFNTSVKVGLNTYFLNEKTPESLSSHPIVLNNQIFVPVEFFERILRQPIFLVRDDLLIVFENKDVKKSILELTNFRGFIKNIVSLEEEHYGKSISHDFLLLGINSSNFNLSEIIIHIEDDTKIYDLEGKTKDLTDLAIGNEVDIVTPLFMTMTYPPQTTAKSIVIDGYMDIERVEENKISYPRFISLGKNPTEESLKEILNDSILNFLNGLEEIKIYEDLKLDYHINYIDRELISLIFTGDYSVLEKNKSLTKTLNLNLKSGMEINKDNYFKNDRYSRELLLYEIRKAAKQQLNLDYNNEDYSIYFSEKYLVVYYFDEEDPSNEVPIELYIPRENLTAIVNF